MTVWATAVGLGITRLKFLPRGAVYSTYFLMAALWMQLFIGVNVIWQSVPIWLASSHQMGAMTVLTALILTMHSVRKPDLRHVKNLLGKLRATDPEGYKKFMSVTGKRINISGKELEQQVNQKVSKMQAPKSTASSSNA